jgi:hypothetical protein
MSHVEDGLIGSMTHLKPYNHPSPTYGENKYPKPYGGTSYYPPPTHQWSYLVVSLSVIGGTPTDTHDTSGLSTKYAFTSQPPHTTLSVEVLQIPTFHINSLHKTIHTFLFMLLPSQFLLNQESHMSALILFNPLPFKRFIILNS